MIKCITIERLYDKYDYDIQIPDDQPITIFTGPNGYGKTTILKVISHLFSCNFWYFSLLRFKMLTFHFRDGKQMIISKHAESHDNNTEREDHSFIVTERVNFHFLDKENNSIEVFYIKNADWIRWEQLISRNQRYTAVREKNNNYREEFYSNNFHNIEDSAFIENSKYTRMFMQGYSCSFIKEQRLTRPSIVEERRFYRDTTLIENEAIIEDIANHLRAEFIKVQQRFAIISQEIDATFIKRLIENPHEPYTEDEFRNRLDNLKKKMNDFSKYGLAPKAELLNEYPEEQRKALSLYIDDIEEKLSYYDSFYKRLSVFDNFIFSKELSDKRIELNSSKGIAVYDDLEQEIPLSNLSSGEQHLIILYYKLSFELNSKSLLLIDEPENSLHPAWQSQMLDDYLKMAKELECQIIVATHSPVFINGRWDITFDLFENRQK